MKFFKLKTNLTIIQKIVLAGLFMALAVILQKVIAVNYIPGLPFFRISFGGPAIIVLSSVLLGPWFGLLVGAGSDILGYFIFDMSGNAWFPQITLTYALLGFASYFIFEFVRLIKNKKLMLIIESLGFAAFFIGVLVYFLNDTNAEVWQKILFPSAVLLLSSAIILFEYIFGNKVKVLISYNFYQTTFALFVIEVVIMLLFGSLMKALCFGFELFPIIIICQLMVLFVNVAINSIVVTSLLKLTNKYFIEKIN